MQSDSRFAIVVASIHENIVRAEREIVTLTAEDPEVFRCLIREYEGQIKAARLALAAICGVVNVDPLALQMDGPCATVVAWAKAIYPEGRWAA